MHPWLTLFMIPAFIMANSQAQTLKPSLQVETENGEKTFHLGELIPLRLSFFNPEGKPYLVDHEPCGSRSCGAFGKPETFAVQPATGWSDPLVTYFAQDFAWAGSSHPRQPPTEPLQVRLDLNEWIRFDQPGDYTVRITSHRVESSAAGPNALVAGSIVLHIVPATPEWQWARLQWIRTIRDPYNREWPEALEDLRYLATPAAAEEMVSRLRDERGHGNELNNCPMCMGIIGLPDPIRKMAAVSMSRRIAEPDFPISPMFFQTMVFLRGGSACHGGDLRPACPYDALLWLKVDSALARKKAEARAETLKTLNQVGSYVGDARVKERMRSLPRRTWSIPN